MVEMFLRRQRALSFVLAVLTFGGLGGAARAQVAQQVLRNSDVSLSAFGQFSSDVSSNGIQQTTTKSLGGQAAFRHSYHWWLGYEASYGYTRYAERYTGQVFSYQHNAHEFGGTYLVQGPHALGLQPFGGVGVSALIFSPSLNGGQHAEWQGRTAVNFTVGINHPLLTNHIGVRLQYRGLYYKAPDFGQVALKTNSFRITSEPTVGVYLKF
ncbi:porin family protein [Paracidobacterium acidisoli]|nr:porin family protein [Paracidobacterium acidisoli]MBT9331663.1 hypothetical protein [Paracidobacterium acidisoli]